MPTSTSGQQEAAASSRLTEKRDSQQSSLSSGNSQDGDLSLLSSNAADYDRIKNTTLMFFLDRLFIASKDNREAHTLHDLSCLFGTRDFSREMRQIVGASRNGLKKFLQSYPSLFTIEGERVYLTQLRQEAAVPTRDYNREAVEYFTQKLEQFGPSLVPVKNLFGYRSQATQEVRHVSGKNAREFKLFLRQHEDVFEMLADDHVILRSALRELEARGESQSTIRRIATLLSQDGESAEQSGAVMDPYLNKQFASLVEDCLAKLLEHQAAEQSGAAEARPATRRVGLEFLHARILAECQNPVFLRMVTTVEDFKVFLRMHPKIFKRIAGEDGQLDYVTLLSGEERRELELQAYPSAPMGHLSRQHSTLERSVTAGSSGQPVSLPPLHRFTATSATTNTSNPSTESKPSSAEVSASANRQQQASDLRSASSALRANAPPFVPSPRSALRASVSSQAPQRSHSSLTSQARPSDPHLQRAGPVDPKQALRNHLMKASLENASNGMYSPSKQSNGAQHHNNINNNSSLADQDDLRARTVDIVREASNIITRIMTTAEAVAFDCKGYNLGFSGQITLIQFGFLPTKTTDENARPSSDQQEPNSKLQKPEVCIFDLITNPELAYCLKPLLESDQIVKIVHDVRNKSNALHVQFGIMLKHVFDTQVANLVIQQQETGKPAYKSRYISMSKLCEIYGDDSLMKYRNLINSKTRHSGSSGQSAFKLKDVNYWRARPLTDAMIYESTLDVYCLVGGIHQNLRARIKPEYKPLFEQLNLEGVLARIKPEEIRSVKKERKIDLEVIELKRKLYSESTGSIVLSNREIRLLRHIDLTDEVRSKIRHCKKVVKKLERLDMKATMTAQQSMQSFAPSGEQSLDLANASINSSGHSHSSRSSSGSLIGNQAEEACQSLPASAVTAATSTEPTDEMVVNELMDGSMFDEFKDRMIESSGLLESLEDDDEEAMREIHSLQLEAQLSHHHRHSQGHPSNGSDCCSCQCHSSQRSSLATTATTGGEKEREKSSLSVESTRSASTDEDDCGSTGSKAVDMAIQCDLLS